MGLDEEKLQFINSYFQIVKLDMEGKVVDSSDEITTFQTKQDLTVDIPFISSIIEVLNKLKINADVSFHCIQSEFFGLGEYYDFIFKRTDKNIITWLICDYTDQYRRTIDLQQERNSGSMAHEMTLMSHANELKEVQRKNDNDHIFLKIDSLLVRLKLEDMCYIEAYGDYIKVHTLEKTHVSYAKLKNIEEILPSARFVRIHRSYIINIDKIETMNQQNIQIGDKIIPVSLTYKDELLSKIQKLN
ncbi:MAG: LytTR family DNA-binding domain-containing protein [Cyclobacteriaceae bacterium]